MSDIEQTKLRLEQMLRELTERAEEIDEDLSSPGDDDWQEAATESASDEVLEEVGDVTIEEIAQIKLALAQIAAGRYGICVVCAGSIGEGRLKALPYATKCVNCA
jgi:RNA polymerase-binding transcription factor DksA